MYIALYRETKKKLKVVNLRVIYICQTLFQVSCNFMLRISARHVHVTVLLFPHFSDVKILPYFFLHKNRSK